MRAKLAGKTSLIGIKSYEGDSIEARVRKIMASKEPITDGAPIIHHDRKEGVLPQHDIRTDRWELANEAMDKVTMDRRAKREGKVVEMGNGKAEPTQGTEGASPVTE